MGIIWALVSIQTCRGFIFTFDRPMRAGFHFYFRPSDARTFSILLLTVRCVRVFIFTFDRPMCARFHFYFRPSDVCTFSFLLSDVCGIRRTQGRFGATRRQRADGGDGGDGGDAVASVQ